jgi:hypothetical protein
MQPPSVVTHACDNMLYMCIVMCAIYFVLNVVLSYLRVLLGMHLWLPHDPFLPHNFLFIFPFFINLHSGGGVQTGSTLRVGHSWSIVPAPGDCEDAEFGGMKIGRGG